LNTYNSLRGTGRILGGGLPIGKVEYELLVNQYGDGERLAFGSGRVTGNVLRRLNEVDGPFVLELENRSGKVQVELCEVGKDLIHFDATGTIPGL
jgi:hypothetical protein